MATTTFKFTLHPEVLDSVAAQDAIKAISPTLKPSASDALNVKLNLKKGWELSTPAFYNPEDVALKDANLDKKLIEVKIPVYGREQYFTLTPEFPTVEIGTEDPFVIAWYNKVANAIVNDNIAGLVTLNDAD